MNLQRPVAPLPHSLQDKPPGSTKKILCIAETLKPVQGERPPLHTQRRILPGSELFCSAGMQPCTSHGFCPLASHFHLFCLSGIPGSHSLIPRTCSQREAAPREASSRAKPFPKTPEGHRKSTPSSAPAHDPLRDKKKPNWARVLLENLGLVLSAAWMTILSNCDSPGHSLPLSRGSLL